MRFEEGLEMRCYSYGLILLVPLFGCCGCEKVANTEPGSSQQSGNPAAELGSDDHPEGAGEEVLRGDYVAFPSAGVEIRRPEGFDNGSNFEGFQQAETQSSILAMSIGGPFEEMTAAFTKEQMSGRGWTLLDRTEHKVQNFDGILVHFKQPVGTAVFLKWCLAFGDAKRTRMVTATFPAAQERNVSERLRLAVLSTRPSHAASPAPGTDLPFTITGSQKLKLTPVASKMLCYTIDGVVPVKSAKEPLFIAATSVGSGPVKGDKRQYAEQRLHQTAQIASLSIQSTEAVTVDGLDGYESVAEAEDAKSGAPLAVYQVMLFDGSSYILMQGLVGREQRDEFLPEFKAMARSLRRKQS